MRPGHPRTLERTNDSCSLGAARLLFLNIPAISCSSSALSRSRHPQVRARRRRLARLWIHAGTLLVPMVLHTALDLRILLIATPERMAALKQKAEASE